MDRELEPFGSCIVEYLVWHSPDDSFIKKVIQAFPPFEPNPQLKKALLLRHIRTVIMAGDVPEEILDVLEKIGCIDSNQGTPIPNSMKEAYCAVALDCTAKYLVGDPNTSPKYLEAVDRIWRSRIQDLEKSKAADLVCEQLRNRRVQVEAAATGDKEVVFCLTEMNTLGSAILSLKHYLLEAFGAMKPPALEDECLKLESKDKSVVWEGGNNRVLKLPLGGSFGMICHWNSAEEMLELLPLSSEEYDDSVDDAGHSESTSTTDGLEVEASPFVGQWQERRASLMRSNEHHNRELERRWDTTGLEGLALKLVEGDKSLRN